MKRHILLISAVLLIFLTACETERKVATEKQLDLEAPVITLLGDETIYLEIGDEFIDPGFNVTDNQDDDITLIISGTGFDTNYTNLYHIYYNAVDKSGNVSEQVIREVYVSYKVPGIITSFTYESYDFLGVSILVLDMDDTLNELSANLYDGDTLIESVLITEQDQAIMYTGLESGIDYQLVVEGAYDAGCSQPESNFDKTPINVGVYRRIEEDLRSEINNDIKFDALQQLIYLPYDQSNYTKSKEMILTLAHVDEELLTIFATAEEKIILVDGVITEVYEYHHLQGEPIIGDPKGDTVDDRPGICCSPTVIKIGYQGTSISLTLQITGTLFHSYFYEESITEEFIAIYELEASTMFPSSQYQDGAYLYFIETFAYYYFSDLSNTELQTNAPQTHQYISDLIEQVTQD